MRTFSPQSRISSPSMWVYSHVSSIAAQNSGTAFSPLNTVPSSAARIGTISAFGAVTAASADPGCRC